MHDYTCDRCDFTSEGWPTQKAARDRGKQHTAEHDSGEPMPELAESGIRGAVQEA